MEETILTANALKFRYDPEQPVYALNGVSASTDQLTTLLDASTQIQNGIAQLDAGAAQLDEQVSYDAYKAILKENGLDLDQLKDGNAKAMEQLEQLARVMPQLKDVILLLKGSSANIDAMETYLNTVHDGVAQLHAGSSTLNSQYGQFDAGVRQLANALTGMLGNLSVLTDGVNRALLPMALGGVAFGLGCAAKWTGIYAGAGLAVMQNLQGCFHAVRAGVIAILNKGHTAVLHNVLAHTGGLIAGQRTGGAGTLQPQTGGCSVSSKGIIHGMNACRGDGYTELIGFTVHVIHQGKAGTLPYGMNIDGAHIGGAGADAEPHRAQAAGDLCGGQQVIVRVQHQRGAVRQALADFHLCLQYILPRAQIFQVGNADHRNDTGRRPRCAH